ncbi:hypothetical protein B0A49_03755 [Cryomyces minteri]|uniref:Uncharacterized protein n=1 Tax=Cryomyces minteri TaxID=331657 RepID=A0A4U0WZK4_9PEZI|nr:hypothetical protein B0A49_03755 [Cryomyces minteri]
MSIWPERQVAVARRSDRTEAREVFGAEEHRARTQWLRTTGVGHERELERWRLDEQASQAATDKKAVGSESAQAREGWERDRTARPPQGKPKEQTEPQLSEATKVWSEESHRKNLGLIDEWLEAARETWKLQAEAKQTLESSKDERQNGAQNWRLNRLPMRGSSLPSFEQLHRSQRRRTRIEAWQRLKDDDIALGQIYRILIGDEDTSQRRRENELRVQCEGGLAPEEMKRILWRRVEVKVVEKGERLAKAKRQA